MYGQLNGKSIAGIQEAIGIYIGCEPEGHVFFVVGEQPFCQLIGILCVHNVNAPVVVEVCGKHAGAVPLKG